MAKALKDLAVTGKVTAATRSPHGEKYVMVGRIQPPGGQGATVQCIWIVDKGQATARLVTAYPRKP